MNEDFIHNLLGTLNQGIFLLFELTGLVISIIAFIKFRKAYWLFLSGYCFIFFMRTLFWGYFIEFLYRLDTTGTPLGFIFQLEAIINILVNFSAAVVFILFLLLLIRDYSRLLKKQAAPPSSI